MATRLKTVEFTHPVTAAATNNTLTTATQITVYLPETGTKTFRSVVATLSAMNTSTATGNITSRLLQCRLGAAAYTANSNANAITTSAEDIYLFHAVNLTSHFQTNWTGTSMTFDSQFTLNGAGTGSAWTNVNVTLQVTYEYDDTSTTQVKTVWIPLNAPVGALATTKPGAAIDTIPNLSTELPETSKVFRSIHTVVQGNAQHLATTTDATITQQIDATAAHTSGVFESLSGTDYWFRYVWDCSGVLVTNATNGWYIYASVATKFNHLQAWLVVTYEFDASASTNVFVSVKMPQDSSSPMGGTTTADYSRFIRPLSIQEPGTITTKQIAFYPFWTQLAAISTLNFRVGTGGFVAYTDGAATTAGSNGAMIRNDAAFTLARGRNTLTADAYRSDATDLGYNLSGFWIVNYTADKPTQGIGAANHTVYWNSGVFYDGTSTNYKVLTAFAPTIPETEYYLTSAGTKLEFYCGGTIAPTGVAITVERLAAEGGVGWENILSDVIVTDPELGIITSYSQIRTLFGHHPTDPAGDLVFETARRWRILIPSATTQTAWMKLDLMFSYHSISKPVAGTVSGYAGTGVGIPVSIHRTQDGEMVNSTVTTAGGAFTVPVYYDTDTYYVCAQEDATHVGRSAEGSP